MKSDIIKDFSLPLYVKGKTFAEASKAIDNKFKDREDPHAEATKKELLARLSSAQEHIKMKEEAAQQAANPVLDQNQMFAGGLTPAGIVQGPSAGQLLAQSGTAGASQLASMPLKAGGVPGASMGAGPVGTIAESASTFMDLGYQALGPTGVDESGKAGYQDYLSGGDIGMQTGKSALKGAAAGAAVGSVVPVIGTAIGAVVGGVGGAVSGFVGGKKKNKALLEANKNAGLVENNKFTNDFFGGGEVTTEEEPKPKKNPLIMYDQIDRDLGALKTVGGDIDASTFGASQLKQGLNPSLGETLSKVGDKTGKFLKDNHGSILNAAPIAMNALQLAQLEKADQFSYDRLNARYKENPVDERVLENKVQNEATNTTRALANVTNGNAGALASNLIGSQLAKTNALSDAYLKATQMNSEDKRFGQQFNSQQDALNQRTSILETNERRADEAAYGNAKSLLMGQLGENIGDFGKEANYKKIAVQSTDYSWDGKYYVDHEGRKITKAQYDKIKAAEAAKSKS